MRPLIIALVATGVILMGWLLLRGEGGDTSSQATPSTVPSTWWTNALGVLTSPFAPAVKMSSLTFTFRSRATTIDPSTGAATVDSSTGVATVTLPPGKGPRVARFKMDDGANAVVQINYKGPTPDKDAKLCLVPPGMSASPPTACDPSTSAYPKGSLAVRDDGGTVTLGLMPTTSQPNAPKPSQPPGAKVTLVP